MPNLVLTRRPGESIKIGEAVTMTIVRIDGNKVRIAFEAPKELKIWRTELLKPKDKTQ